MLKYLLLNLALAATLVSCTKSSETSSTNVAAKASEELTVGTDAAYAPFEIETPDKTIQGFDIDLINSIATKAGFKVKVVNTPWEGLFNQLASGDRDILISAITISDERKKVMAFSEPYFEAVQVIALPAKSKVAKFADLKKMKVGVQIGTTGDEVVSRLLGKANANIKRFEGTPLALQELSNGGVDAVVADNGVVRNFLANNTGSFKTLSDTSFSKEYYGIAVKHGRDDLLKKINEALAAIKADGTYDAIYKKYFGEAAF